MLFIEIEKSKFDKLRKLIKRRKRLLALDKENFSGKENDDEQD